MMSLWLTAQDQDGSGGGWVLYPPLPSETSWQDTALRVLSMLDLAFWGLLVVLVGALAVSLYLRRHIITALFGGCLFLLLLVPWSLWRSFEADRNFGTQFFDPAGGGDPVLFQHLFWFFGHLEVYLWLIPFVVGPLIALGVVKRAAIFSNRVGALFLLSGLLFTGIGMALAYVLARSGIDTALHDTYYVIAHVHYVGSVLLVMLVFAAVYYLCRPVIGVAYNVWLGLAHWALMTAGGAMILAAQVMVSVQGMPRRYIDSYETPAAYGFFSSIGTFVTLISVVLFAICVIEAIYRRIRHGKDTAHSDD